ncbi:MAG: hypothetical protein KAS12_01185 [Candidatus Aenigmarchaeota archaeon]|nr:hypothetical protein [Candidatus Aenigmarchaeota archaeon]
MTEDMCILIDTFNRSTMRLINILISYNKSDLLLDQTKRQMSLGVNANPYLLVNSIGPCFYEYKDQIKNDIVGFLERTDFSKNYQSSENYQEIEKISKTIRSTWKSFKPKEKEIISDIVIFLYETYIKYLIACKCEE